MTTDLDQIGFVCLTEHCLREWQLPLVQIEGYMLGSSYCRQSDIRGGVCIYVKENLSFKEIKGKRCLGKHFEVAAVDIKELNITVLCVYRTPDSNVNVFLKKLELLETLTGKIGNLFCVEI